MKIKKFKSRQDDFEGEIWKQYADFDNYLISNFGRIKKKSTNKIKYSADDGSSKSYKMTSMIKDGVSYKFRIHVLVLLTFIGERPKGMFACHNNGNRRDNRLDNLRWGTHKDNIKDAIDHGVFNGYLSRRSNLNEFDVIAIRSYKHHYKLNKKLADYYGVSVNVIYDIRKRKSWKHV